MSEIETERVVVIVRVSLRDRVRGRQTDRQTDRQTYRQTDRQRETDRQTDRDRERVLDRSCHTWIVSERQGEKQKNNESDRSVVKRARNNII